MNIKKILKILLTSSILNVYKINIERKRGIFYGNIYDRPCDSNRRRIFYG